MGLMMRSASSAFLLARNEMKWTGDDSDDMRKAYSTRELSAHLLSG